MHTNHLTSHRNAASSPVGEGSSQITPLSFSLTLEKSKEKEVCHYPAAVVLNFCFSSLSPKHLECVLGAMGCVRAFWVGVGAQMRSWALGTAHSPLLAAREAGPATRWEAGPVILHQSLGFQNLIRQNLDLYNLFIFKPALSKLRTLKTPF